MRKTNKKPTLKKLFLLSFVLLFLSIGKISQADTSFSFSVPEGQGSNHNEFYHGRCVRVDVMLDTDGHATGGADLEINYDNSRIQIVNSDCSTPATTIYPGTQYDNYPNNHVTSNKITLGAYDNPGNSYTGSGRFAYFYFTVLDGAGDYDLDFEFTPGNTTDTNLAESGSGNDILQHADSYTLHFADDDDTPYVTNENPAGGDSNVPVIANIQHRLNDDDAGVNFSTLTESLTGANWGTTNYTAGSPQVSHSCHTTNANRVPYCDVTINPTNNLYYCENYTVNLSFSDLGNPIVHSLNNYNYTFSTEPDNDPVEIYNQNPNNGATGISPDSNISLNLRDLANPGGYPGTGVNISTLTVTVSAPGWGSQTYTVASPELTATPLNTNDYGNVYDYSIVIDPANDFPENTLVTVTVDVDDYGCPSVNHQHLTYSFTTADTQGPVCTLFTPTPGVVNVGTADNITFHCTDSGVGVDINTVTAQVDGIVYTATGANQFTYSGTPADYFITVDPASNFALDHAWEVVVNARDFSNNAADQVAFGLASGVNGSCPDCEACPVCETCEETSCDCEEKTKTVTKYKDCTIINQITKKEGLDKWLPAKSKISNSQLSYISLNEINDINIHKLDKLKTNSLSTAIVGGEKQVLVTVSSDKVVFEGTALPNTQITLMIESTPIIVTGLSDNNGYWRIEMANIFTNGMHKVSAVTLSEDNYIVKTKELAKFRVLRFRYGWWCWLLLLIMLLLTLNFYRKYKRFQKKYCQLKPKDRECDKIKKWKKPKKTKRKKIKQNNKKSKTTHS